MGWLKFALKLGFFQGQRRTIGILLALATAAIDVATNSIADCAGSSEGICGLLTQAQPWILRASAYIGTVGVVFKNDPQEVK